MCSLEDSATPKRSLQKNGSIMLHDEENPTNRDRSRHVDVKAHYLRGSICGMPFSVFVGTVDTQMPL